MTLGLLKLLSSKVVPVVHDGASRNDNGQQAVEHVEVKKPTDIENGEQKTVLSDPEPRRPSEGMLYEEIPEIVSVDSGCGLDMPTVISFYAHLFRRKK
eukprot:CAMPEP_0185044134 /NCGR_PEP_ID=MMETSP1103-20130426/43285_1 /TAXON_ID=36769 /ORGANISM="Paraphysomonas bandaiensis, Strain Caron Lab Isolate" /LENGTH=97 /DNA_ID=CAMNT_0027584371 /DNA_START=658 /DNA_END=951 /DNA_ORIENTATION=-